MLSKEEFDLIQDNQAQAIADQELTKEMLSLAYRKNWFNLWVPQSYGGLGTPLLQGCQLLEELAYADGGFGWTVTLCSGANMFAGFIDPTLAATVFQQAQVCWGGSGKPSGRADKQAGGYVLRGEWMYATGAPHLSHFTLNAWIYEDGVPVLDHERQPVYRSFFVDRDVVLVHYDWDTFGLECTASHSFSLDGVQVSADRAFDLLPQAAQHGDRLFRYPFLTFAACTLAVNYIGMFRRFLDLLERYYFVKANDAVWHREQGKARFRELDAVREAQLAWRDRLYVLMADTWDSPSEDDGDMLAEMERLSRQIVSDIKTQTVNLYPQAGIAGAQRKNELNIVFRNIFTASQHSLLNTRLS